MGKKKATATGAAFWDGLKGWKSVSVSDDLLLGSDEYGFCGLEELNASDIGGLVIPKVAATPSAEQLARAAADDGAAQAGQPQQQQQQQGQGKAKDKKRKQPEAAGAAAAAEAGAAGAGASKAVSGGGGGGGKKERKRGKKGGAGGELGAVAVVGGGPGGSTVEALKQQLAALQEENQQLKKKKKRKKTEAQVEKRQLAAAKKKAAGQAARQAQRAGSATAAANAAAAEAEAHPAADTAAWKDLELLPAIEAAIAKLGFAAPTHIQSECLPAAIRDRRDVIGAAQTGSGKTLAFGLPIMQLLLRERQQAQQQAQQQAAQQQEQVEEAAADGGGGRPRDSPLRALILAPTRELALQVCEHLQAVGKECGVWVVPIVGGISALKQERLLLKHPEIIVATPGRLWDLMREGHGHVTNLNRLSFLVIDEADRMVQQGHYGELSNILGAIPVHQEVAVHDGAVPEPVPEAEEEEEGEGEEGAHPADVAPEGAELAAAEEGEEEEEEEGSEAEPTDDEADEQQQLQVEKAAAAAAADAERRRQKQLGRRLQTFVFSATLTLPANLRKRLRKGGGGASGSTDLDGLMDQIPFRGKPKIVDLTSQSKLADRITEAYIACGENERDEYLYCLLAKHPGRTIVFVNAISSVRRLAAILKLLGLPAQPLHAEMQQKQRLKALDRFKADDTAVLVATDVAARGLDIKNVRCVVHYQLPASMDLYVHRSGRTARAEAEGISIALVTPKENARFLALLKAMRRGEPPEFPLDVSLLPAVHRRVRLAVRLDELERKQSKSRAEKAWRQQHAEQLGIELSDESSDEEEVIGRRQGKRAKRMKGGRRGPEEAETAAEVRAELASLLAEPLQPKLSGKWFTGGTSSAVMASVDPSAAVAGGSQKRRQQQQGAAAAAGQQQGGAGSEPPAAEPKTQETVNQAVSLAQQRSDSRSVVAQQAAAKQQRGKKAAPQQGQGQAGKKQQGGASSGKKQQDPRAAALQAALSKAMSAKQRKRAGGGDGGGGRGMYVIPHALGRDAVGPDALQTLRRKLGSL